MKRLCIIAILLVAALPGFAQKMDKDHLSVEAYVRNSHMLNALKIYENLLDGKDCPAFGVAVGVNTRPEDDNYYAWAYNLPRYGLGFSYNAMGMLDCKVGEGLGDVYTLYGFANVDLVRNRFFSFGPKLEFGASYVTKTWDVLTNPKNLYVGTHILVMVGAGLEAGFHITPQWELGLTAMITHRSNGMLKVPNYGLNDISGGLWLRYDLNERHLGKRGARPQIPTFKKWIFDVYASGGVHSCDAERDVYENLVLKEGDQNRWADSKSWLRLGIGGTASYRYHPIFATGVGLDVFYTGNWKRLAEYYELKYGEPTKTSPIYVGAYIQQSFYYRNMEIGIGFGVYLFKRLGIEDSTWNYQRALIRYHIPKAGDIFVGFAMRAHRFDRSDTLEFTFGKRF